MFTMTYKGKICLLAVSILMSIMPFSDSLAETFISISYYVIGPDAFTGDTPLNGVIRIPKENMESFECIESIQNFEELANENSLYNCKPLMIELLKEYGNLVTKLLDFDNELLRRNIATIEIGNSGKAFLYVELYYGGSGGGRKDWTLHLIRNEKNTFGRQPILFDGTPFLAGREVLPGGNTWYETSCEKQEYEKCAERIFYPKKFAFQILFTDTGITTQPLPLNERNPD